MEQKNVTVVAQLQATAGKEAEVRRQLHSLVAPSRKHSGCINYDLHESVETPGLFMFHENWCSKIELEQHLDRSEVKEMLTRVATLLAKPAQISLWQKLA